MTKNLKLSFILLAVFSAIVVAWKTLSSFFNGVAINMVALLIIVAILLIIILTDNFVKNRIKEMFIFACVLAGLELIVFFPFEFGASINALKVFIVFQNIYIVLGLIFMVYIAFRAICEIKGIKFGFIEAMLGNKQTEHKKKKAKEFTNGSLEEKPNNIEDDFKTSASNYNDESIVVEQEEE